MYFNQVLWDDNVLKKGVGLEKLKRNYNNFRLVLFVLERFLHRALGSANTVYKQDDTLEGTRKEWKRPKPFAEFGS